MDPDQEAKVWIYHQLMGKTQKGDTLEFVFITGKDIEVYSGILRDADCQMKVFITAILTRIHECILTIYDYSSISIQVDNPLDEYYAAA